jgi:hypothetical protein
LLGRGREFVRAVVTENLQTLGLADSLIASGQILECGLDALGWAQNSRYFVRDLFRGQRELPARIVLPFTQANQRVLAGGGNYTGRRATARED